MQLFQLEPPPVVCYVRRRFQCRFYIERTLVKLALELEHTIHNPPSRRARPLRPRSPPPGGLFQDQHWRIATAPFPLGEKVARELQTLGRLLLQFYRAVNLLYRQSAAGKQPAWVADWLDRGKPQHLIDLQRDAAFKNDTPRVIRPDILLTDSGLSIIELDSVPGGIGLTAWLNKSYSALDFPVLGGAEA
jgi:hypothetical protein